MKVELPQGTELRLRISIAVAALHGRPAATVETYVDRDLVVCTRHGVAAARRAPLERDLIDVVEGLTERQVVAFLDVAEPHPGGTAELFFLARGDAPLHPACVVAEALPGGAIVSVEGDLDRGTAPEVDREARGQIERGGANLVLDLSRTRFMDTAAIHLMERLGSLVAAAGGGMAVVLTCPRAHRLLELVPPRADLRVVGSVTEATAAWSGVDLADTA